MYAAYVCACVCACMCVRACVRACESVCVYVCVRVVSVNKKRPGLPACMIDVAIQIIH